MFQAWPVKIISTAANSRPTLLSREQGAQGEQQARQEGQHRNALQNVQERNQHPPRDASFAAQ